MWRRAMIAVGVVVLAGCPAPSGNDLFRVAASGTPGSLLSVWGEPGSAQHAYIAGCYVGVDATTIADGTVGRLVEYTRGTFRTLCRTDQVLWWVTGAADGSGTIFIVGEGGRVMRYSGGHCETLPLGVTYPEGLPTFFGAYAPSSTELWLVGGSAQPTGPRGVLVHWDGTSFRQEMSLPTDAQHANLFKVDMRTTDGHLQLVGTQGVILDRDPTTGTWSDVQAGIRTQDNWFFTVSCNGAACWAVGGSGQGLIASTTNGNVIGPWQERDVIGTTDLSDLPGLNGVFVQNQSNVFIVGTGGTTMHTNGSVVYRPPTAPTTATLHGVGGNNTVVISVGGELSVTNATQRGVILIRGDDSPQFTFDGQPFMATGDLRTSLGGTGQGGR